MQTLLVQNDVVELSDIGKDVPVCTIKDIAQVERNEFLGCLGIEFYEVLLADVVDYEAQGVDEWVAGTSYTAGDVVKWRGKYYTCTLTGTNTEPLNGDWELSDKFTTDEYNALWCDAQLGRYLATLVAKNKAVKQAIQFEDKGMVRRSGTNFDPATMSEVKQWVTAVDQDIAQMYKYLDWYLTNTEYNTNNAFDLYPPNADSTGCDCGGTCGTCRSGKLSKGYYIVG